MNIFTRSALGLILFLSTLAAQSQESINLDTLKNRYDRYHALDRESVFLHLNKTSVIKGEDLWLAAYIYNAKAQLPNRETVNLVLDIYKEDGTHLETKTAYVSDGKGVAFLDLESSAFDEGRYVLKASTNYMKNFSEDLSYIQEFSIIESSPKKVEVSNDYDLQVLPEGGNLLSGSLNSVGVKLLSPSGQGSAFLSGKIIDSENREIGRFDSNKFGMSKFSFTPALNEEYTVIVETKDGEKIRKVLPKAEEKGINLINTVREDEHFLSIRTNERTRQIIADRKFILAVHKDGQLQKLDLQFPEESLELVVKMKNDSLFPGVNTLTLFNDAYKPVAERMIFNGGNLKRTSVKAKVISKSRDSLTINISGPKDIDQTSLSISVLPSQTRSYNPNNNIISAFHLKPYVKGHVDEAEYYFDAEEDFRKIYDLDLLLLSQGWSKYDWSNTWKSPPVLKFEHQKGFEIEGRLNRRNQRRHNNVLLASDQTGFFEVVEIENDDSFKAKHAFLLDSTFISVGILNSRNNKVVEPSVEAKVYPLKKIKNIRGGFRLVANEDLAEFYNTPEAFPDSGNVLDTVNISAPRKIDRVFVPERQVFERGYVITEDIANQYHYITDYIATKGFQVRKIQGNLEIRSYRVSTIGKPPKLGEYRTAQSNVMLYLNGAPVGTNPSFLNGLLASQVESIIINKMGFGHGFDGVNGVIKINMKKGGGLPQRDTIEEIISNNGFVENKEFYTPRYKTYSSTSFEHYGAIDWKPSVHFDDDGQAQITIANRGATILFVEGMGADGNLVSEKIILNDE